MILSPPICIVIRQSKNTFHTVTMIHCMGKMVLEKQKQTVTLALIQSVAAFGLAFVSLARGTNNSVPTVRLKRMLTLAAV